MIELILDKMDIMRGPSIMNTLEDAVSIVGNASVSASRRLEMLGDLDLSPDDMRAVGSALYCSMLKNSDILCGDCGVATSAEVRCGIDDLSRIVDDMIRQQHISWQLLSIERGDMYSPVDPVWIISVVAFGRDVCAASTLGDVLLMSSILEQTDISSDQPFDRWTEPYHDELAGADANDDA